jgi:hypothetical protein
VELSRFTRALGAEVILVGQQEGSKDGHVSARISRSSRRSQPAPRANDVIEPFEAGGADQVRSVAGSS